jgi:hypothetical protein
MLRFLTVPKDSPEANILFTEFTDHDGLLDALRWSLANARVMLQAHTNRRTAAFVAFYDNWNVAIWPRKIFTPDEYQALRMMFGDMRRMLGYHILRTIIGEDEEVTMAALLASGWQQDGVYRKISRTPEGVYRDGLILSFDDTHPEKAPDEGAKEDSHELRDGHVQQAQAETDHHPEPDAGASRAPDDADPLHAAVDADESAEPGAIWPF